METCGSRISALNSHFEGNMASKVKTVEVGGSPYKEVIDFQPHFIVSLA